MTETITTIYFVENAQGLIHRESVSSSEGYAKVRYVAGFLPFDNHDAVDIENVWKIAEKNGVRMRSVQFPVPHAQTVD